jgi:hypothetical protein
MPFYVGDYTVMDSTNVNATACGFTPTTYYAQHMNVYVASGFHRGGVLERFDCRRCNLAKARVRERSGCTVRRKRSSVSGASKSQ